jgi:hypothetical protein
VTLPILLLPQLALTSTDCDRTSLPLLPDGGGVAKSSSLLLLLDSIRALRDELEGSLAALFHARITADEELDDTDDDDDMEDDDWQLATLPR